MLAFEFFSWWYGAGWRDIVRQSLQRLRGVSDAFSVTTLLRTLFSPWRRIVSYPGSGLEAHLRAAVDNAVSRFIGFLVRLLALLAACCMFGVCILFGALTIVVWPVLPLTAIGLIIWGVL